jgi:hypothetical protein
LCLLQAGHIPKWDEIIIYIGQGRKFQCYVSAAAIPDKCVRRNKASNIEPSKQFDSSGNDLAKNSGGVQFES